jgi:hypothetical protein
LAQATGSIAGVLRDSSGAPMAQVRMTAEAPGGTPSFSATTDAAGRYRIGNVSPGTYVVSAGPASRPTYYPGRTTAREAVAVTVGLGTQVIGIDFTMLTSPGVTVKGRVVQPASNASLNPSVWLSSFYTAQVQMPAIQIPSALGPDGAFEFRDVFPGTYSIRVLSGTQNMLLAGRPTTLVVEGSDIALPDLVLPAFFEVNGRILVDGEATLPADLERQQVEAKLSSASYFSRPGTIGFILPQGDYSISVPALPMNYSVESIVYGNTDLRAAPFRLNAPMSSELVVRLATFPAKTEPAVTVRGKVTNLPAASLIQDPKVRLTRDARAGGGGVETRVNSDGTFEFARVPPGAYTVSTRGLSASFTSTLNVADSDIQNMTIALAGIANPFPEFPGGSVQPVFDFDTVITLRGVITQEITQIRPPAAPMYLATGIAKSWAVLTYPGARSPAAIPDIEKLKVGTRVSINVNVARDGGNRALLVRIPDANTSVGLNVE